jgi:hypothetical protein
MKMLYEENPELALVAKLKSLISDAKNLSLSELYKAGDYKGNPDLRYPQTDSVRIVVEALNLLLDQDWVDDDPLLDEMASVFGQLDTDVNKLQTWQSLFELAKELDEK